MLNQANVAREKGHRMDDFEHSNKGITDRTTVVRTLAKQRLELSLRLRVEFEPDAEIDLIEFSGMRLELMELFGREVDLVTPAGLKPLIKNSILSNRVVVYAV